MSKFKIIVTRDRNQHKVLKCFADKHNAIASFNNIIKDNQEVKFDKKFVNYKPAKFHIELLTPRKFSDIVEWEKDDLGRNTPTPQRGDLWVWKLSDWKEPENFTIYNLPGRYEFDDLMVIVEKTKDLVSMSIIQNILVFDFDGIPILVILKNREDATRLYNVIREENLNYILPFGHMSKINRKLFYQKAAEFGIPVELFHHKSTRW